MNLLGSKELETERLILKSSKMEEQQRLYEILMIPKVNKWYLTSGKKHSNEKEYWSWENQKKFYESKVAKASNKDVFTWSIFLKENSEVIGQISVQEKGEDLSIRDIGWYIDPKYQGKGYATEAAKIVLNYMFYDVQIEKIDSGAVKNNIASCRIFEKSGFKYTGEETKLSKYTFYDGELTYSKYVLDKDTYFKNNGFKFSYYNPSNEHGNCILRTLTKLLDKDYEVVKQEINDLAKSLNYDTYIVEEVFTKYLNSYGYNEIEFDKSDLKSLKLDNGKYSVIVGKGNFCHMIPIIDNVIYDKKDEYRDMEVLKVYKYTKN